MRAIIFGQHHPALRAKLVILYLLNAADIGLTYILLSQGGFVELNPLIGLALQNAAATVMVKLLLPAALLVYLDFRMKEAEARQLKACRYIICGLLILYAAVNAIHLFLLFS